MKSSSHNNASYAKGGDCITTTSQFLKTPDRFRDSQFKKGTEDVWGKGESTPNPKGKDKSLKPVKPRG